MDYKTPSHRQELYPLDNPFLVHLQISATTDTTIYHKVITASVQVMGKIVTYTNNNNSEYKQ